MKEELYVVKIGGNIIAGEDELNSFLVEFSQIPGKKALVHGGGKVATEIGNKLGITAEYHEGRRITDDETIDLATMVYGGLLNKKIVAAYNALGGQAIGLTGADANLILAHKRSVVNGVDFGWVGDIDAINREVLLKLIEAGLTPILAPLTYDATGQMLNTNADTIAAEVARAMAGHFDVKLIYCFEKNGVLNEVTDNDSYIQRLNSELYHKLKTEGKIHTGMLPKLSNAFSALEAGVSEVTIGHARNIGSLTQKEFRKCTRINL